ncbi:MAG: hypothetical protein JJE27_06660, partial [Thermoleophilia bacterium]|nr:hypothetical protein [Thermoleophilia bacterium]
PKLFGRAILAKQVHVVTGRRERTGELRVVDVATGAAQRIAMKYQYPHRAAKYNARGRQAADHDEQEAKARMAALTARFSPGALIFCRLVGVLRKYHLRSAGYKRDIVVSGDGAKYVDRQSGTPFKIVGEVLPLAPSASNLPWSEDNLRLCGCSREQLVQRDVNDCPYCDRRVPAATDAAGNAV